MTIYTFPDELWVLSQTAFNLRSLSAMSPQSAFNPVTFTDGPTSEFWQAQVTIAIQDEANWRALSALIRKLRGRRNSIRLFDRARRLRGVGGASPVLNILEAAEAGATEITLYGLTPDTTVSLAADDLIGIGENLYAASDGASSNADGECTISILPPLRSGVAYGDAVNSYYPTGLFQLVSGAEDLTITPPLLSAPLTLTFAEVPDFD